MKHLSTLALLGGLALAPCAFAQDAGTSTAAGKRFAVVGGYAFAEPTGSVDFATGRDADLDGDSAPSLSGSVFINDNIAIEAWGTDRLGHRLRVGDAKAGSVSAQPYALSGQYHFGGADRTVRPFVGLGAYEMNFNEEEAQAGGAFTGQRIGVETSRGPMATVGADLAFGPAWFARGDVRYLHGTSDVSLNGVQRGEVDVSPVVVGIGVGARF